ncbi:Methylase involved in ubiquinone/menaquinone biosynthesis [Desulfosarcina cetonica]|nr:Methylase involved in ubiquinone/menaquinone biosynthesis [Desulfosarcina cetonica]
MTDDHSHFWEERWQSIIDASPLRRRRKGGAEAMGRWDKMAADFAQRTADPTAAEKRRRTVAWMTDRGALPDGARVLDIGAGPGNWSLLLAEAGARVTALEPSGAMVDILKGRMAEQGISAISTDQRTWQAVDLARDGWEGAFDLVFASMTPGIDGPANLRKMMAASKGHCYLSAFSGLGWHQWYGTLWRELFAETLDGHPGDIIHPFNLVYAMGYRPELRFDFWQRENRMSRDKAIADFTTHLEGFTDLTDALRDKVAAFVDQRCENGHFVDERRACQGMMLWSVNQKIHDPTEDLQ